MYNSTRYGSDPNGPRYNKIDTYSYMITKRLIYGGDPN
jgi:hypothetical protein